MTGEHYVRQEDIQGNILCGYGNSFRYALYLFIRFGDDQEATRNWLRELIPNITTAEPWRPLSSKPAETLNIAFTHRGLKRLGLPKAVRKTFPLEFRKGMKKRADYVGDKNESAPDRWEPELGRSDAVLIVMAQDDVRAEREAEHREQIGGHGGHVTYGQHAGLLEGGPGATYAREHFGFADGFSQPAIRGNGGPNTREGMGTPTEDGWEEVAPGEFVLGYRGEDGLLPYAPAAPLGHGGSFMVLRKLKQDVPGFRSYLRSVAEMRLGLFERDPPGPNDPDRAEQLAARERLIAAKMVGRWQDGRSLVTSSRPVAAPGDPELDPTRINRFRYNGDQERLIDSDGGRCPIGAHVRRANPRDSLGWEGLLTKRHRIIRRGVPYGDPLPQGEADDRDRGLIFVCYQASIERQFELIQSRWLNDGDALWLGTEKDCLSTDTGMTVQGPQSPTYLPPSDAPFVITRGGDYFFAPGVPALRALAAAYWT
jgi:Dyp-type peroxidase family